MTKAECQILRARCETTPTFHYGPSIVLALLDERDILKVEVERLKEEYRLLDEAWVGLYCQRCVLMSNGDNERCPRCGAESGS